MTNDDKTILYLYRDIGLYWEHTLHREDQSDRCSLMKNKGLHTFFKSGKIVLQVTTLDHIEDFTPKPQHVACTDRKSSKVKSLVCHLRNSIMHGNYRISRNDSKVWTAFEDLSKQSGKTTLKGNIELAKLKEMMNIIKNYNG